MPGVAPAAVSFVELLLLPLRDLAGFVSTVAAFAGTTVVWGGTRFVVGRRGRMVAQGPAGPASAVARKLGPS